jgi:hypothetical protein
MTRCKLKLVEVTEVKNHEGIVDQLVCSFATIYEPDDEVNKSFSKWTPSAHFGFNVTNPDVFPQMQVGKYYYFDIHQAEE